MDLASNDGAGSLIRGILGTDGVPLDAVSILMSLSSWLVFWLPRAGYSGATNPAFVDRGKFRSEKRNPPDSTCRVGKNALASYPHDGDRMRQQHMAQVVKELCIGGRIRAC